jgi:hypothetical protein|tara:strand:- start:1598 stop:1705 length:108 start_codon:yes stop_codon:yes gene_type:complete
MEETLIWILRMIGAIFCFAVSGYALLFFDDDNAEF